MKRIIILLTITLSYLYTFAQTYNMDQVNGQTINTCSGTFYDSGGSGGDYSNDETYQVTFCSDQAGSQIQLVFNEFETESCCDHMNIYEGIGTGGQVIVSGASGNSLLNAVIESQGSGCLTIVFESDGSVTDPGWAANISCTFPCQDFTIDMISVSEPYYNTDTIRVCQNNPITFTVQGDYPNNNVNYTQSDATTTFYWDFGDGTDTSAVGLTTVTHTFPEGGHRVVVDAIDNNGCDNSNLLRNVVMVSTTPLFTGTNITDTICPGEQVQMLGYAHTNTWTEPLPAITGDTTFLPDGSGASYQTSLTYDIFASGAVFTDPSNIESLCMELEHSYAGDLDIQLICPNGQTMQLFDGYGSSDIGGEFLGEPTDYSSNPGTPYTYCWSPTATNGTMEDVGANPPTYSFTDNDGNSYTDHQYIPGGTYASSGNWNDLIGCPLNGDWTIRVTDHMGADDGYIFSWTINWDTTLAVSLWTFGNTYDQTQYSWSGLNITSQNNGQATALPNTNDTDEPYLFQVIDDFSCPYDTTVYVHIRALNNPNCCVTPVANAGQNDSICGLSIQLNATLFDPNQNIGLWTLNSGPGNITFNNPSATDAIATADAYGVYSLVWTEFNPNGCQQSDTVIISFNPDPDISLDYNPLLCFGDLTNIKVVHNNISDAPYFYFWNSGETVDSIVDASTGLHKVTVVNRHGCISSDSVILSEPALLQVDVSGNDLLCNGDNTGSVHAEVTGGTQPYSYHWQNGSTTQDLNNIPAGNYIVTVSDANQCQARDSLIINEPPALTYSVQTTSLGCAGQNNGNIDLTVNGGTPGYNYIWSNGETTQDLTNIGGAVYSVTITDSHNCTIEADNIQITEPQPVVVGVTSETTICLSNDIDLLASVTGGTAPYVYHWSTGETTYSINVSPTDTTIYTVSVTDANGCPSNLAETQINVRPPITATAIAEKPVICPGDPLNVTVNASGGNSHYYYKLEDGSLVNDKFTLFPDMTKDYVIEVGDDCGTPPVTTSVHIEVLPAPPLSFIPDVTAGCEPLTVNFLENSDDQGQTYEWDFGDYTQSTDKNPVHIYEYAGDFGVTLTVTSVEGCKTTKHVENLIHVYPIPEPKFSASPTNATVIKPEIHFINQSVGAVNYYWHFGDGTEYVGENAFHTYPAIAENYTVTLVVESEHGCIDSAATIISITDVPTIYFPTAFTPDGDDINDSWKPVGSAIDLSFYQLKIYDRWGELIWETSDYNEGWDGSINNKPAPNGVYFFVINYEDVNGVTYQKAGNFSLYR